MHRITPLPLTRFCIFLTLLIVLTACGGASERDLPKIRSDSSDLSLPSLMTLGAELNAKDLQKAEEEARAADRPDGKAGVVPWSAYRDGDVVRKAVASQVPVYRFYNTVAASHFYTTSEDERASIVANPMLRHLHFEGPAFSASSTPADGFTAVFRFFNTQTGVHFYTTSESERDAIRFNPATAYFNYEGVAYYAGSVGGEGLMPLYRFYVPAKGFHFYTASAAERNSIQNSLSGIYTYEGVSSYVIASATLGELLPHSGNSQCWENGNIRPVPCSSAGAIALHPQQDGHRSGINPISYSLVAGQPATSCVKDNVTGLIWEGKTAAGARSGRNQYSYFRDGRSGDASAYVQTVNALRLCGYNDWRIPTAFELHTLPNYGGPDLFSRVASIDPAWFPNTPIDNITIASDGNTPGHVAYVNFSSDVGSSVGMVDFNAIAINGFHLRLVRASPASAPRFSYMTLPFGADTNDNVTVDAWTGLQWRRCLLGQAWNGSTCVGAVADMNLFSALIAARNAPGWRLPSARELNSLMEIGRFPGIRLDPLAFPGSLGPDDRPYTGNMWTSTPKDPVVSFIGNQGGTSAAADYQGFSVRLVRSTQ